MQVQEKKMNGVGGWHHDGVFKEKECAVCNTLFKPKSGVHKFCSPKCKGKWQYISGTHSTENQYKKISGNWDRYFARLVSRNDMRRENISTEDCLELLEEQDGLCALSGVELTCILKKGERCWTNASLDRIEAGGLYTKDNVQLVCTSLNMWRGDLPLDQFIWWCKKVAENHA
jgi:hypothetical protein